MPRVIKFHLKMLQKDINYVYVRVFSVPTLGRNMTVKEDKKTIKATVAMVWCFSWRLDVFILHHACTSLCPQSDYMLWTWFYGCCDQMSHWIENRVLLTEGFLDRSCEYMLNSIRVGPLVCLGPNWWWVCLLKRICFCFLERRLSSPIGTVSSVFSISLSTP